MDFALATIEPDNFARAVPALCEAGEVDAVLAVGQLGYWSARFPEFPQHTEAEVEAAEALAAAAAARDMPVVVCTVYPDAAPAAALRAGGVPVYREIASGVAALGALARWPSGRPPACPRCRRRRRRCRPARATWPRATRSPRPACGSPRRGRSTTAAEAAAAAAELGFPVVLKALGLLHKSDAGGVVARPRRRGRRRARPLTTCWSACGRRASWSRRRPPWTHGVELIVGCRRDVRFGPLLLVGMGGVFAELIRDVRTALAPVSRRPRRGACSRSCRAAALLRGRRGRPRLDVGAAAEAAAALSRFAAAHPEVAEVEVNPLLVLPSRGAGAGRALPRGRRAARTRRLREVPR